MSIVIDPAKLRGADLVHVRDLDLLEKACQKIGLVFRRNDGHYRVWEHATDIPVAEHSIGMSEEKLEEARKKVPHSGKKRNYEIGLVPDKERGGWLLTSDNDPNMPGSRLLAEVAGPIKYSEGDGTNRHAGEITEAFASLMTAYYREAAYAAYVPLGYSITERIGEFGQLIIEAEIPEMATY